jgi:hypothetical protein
MKRQQQTLIAVGSAIFCALDSLLVVSDAYDLGLRLLSQIA